MTRSKPTYKEIVSALELMCLQYLSDEYGDLDHEHMSAGEHCMDCLERLGLVKGNRFDEDSEYYETNQNDNS